MSYYAYRGRLFTAYRWDKQKKRCFYYFNDPEKMKAYLAPVGQSERAPETYAVPEELLQD
ncbi:MAG: hypothetical protein Q7P63_09235 [Verrucomicrobiota bacterium JB022]|nr:hypothetical protein [Verrucomicrobiota bacterium JB022]